MADITFPSDPGVFRNRESLQESYTPESIVGRDEELKEYRDALIPVVYGENPDNAFVYGKSGVGKTACSKYMMNELTNACESRGVNLTVASINCEQLNTSNQVAARIGEELPVSKNRDPISEFQSGWKVYEELFNRLDETGGIVLIVLDEVDSLENEGLNEVFYQLTRARANDYIENVKIGTVGISSDLTLRQAMRDDVKSSLCEVSIEFPAYDAEQLYEVLEQRVEVAFEPGVVKEDVIRYCSACGAQDGGDARKALDLLRKAGDIARRSETDRVTMEIAREAREEMEAEEVVESIEGLSHHERITMYALATLDAETDDDEKHRSRKVYQRYKELVEEAGAEPLTYRRVQQYLGSFDDMNLTNAETRHRGRRGGTFLVHQLNYNVEAVVEALLETIDECGVHQSIRGHVKA